MKNIKLIPVVLSALVAAPTLVSAQTQNAPVRVAAAQAPMPKAQELLDNLFAPYAAAKTFRGNLNLSIQDNSAKGKLGISELRLKTRYRFNDKGDLQSEDTTAVFVGADSLKQKSELHFIHDSASHVGFFPEKKVWWQEDKELGSQPLFIGALTSLFDAVSEAIEENGATPVISRGVEAGRPVFILKAKLTNGFRVVVDQQTRALRSLELKNVFSIRCSEQTFDEPLTNESFEWTPPNDYKQIEQSESIALLPDFLKALHKKSNTASPTD